MEKIIKNLTKNAKKEQKSLKIIFKILKREYLW